MIWVVLLETSVFPCPICDFGTTDAAFFIMTVFGTLTLSGISFFYIFIRNVGLNESLSSRVLEIENKKPMNTGDNDEK